jgi:hypothetical protein
MSKLKYLTSFLQFRLLPNNLISKLKLESNLLAQGIELVYYCKFVGDGIKTMMLHSPLNRVVEVILAVAPL